MKGVFVRFIIKDKWKTSLFFLFAKLTTVVSLVKMLHTVSLHYFLQFYFAFVTLLILCFCGFRLFVCSLSFLFGLFYFTFSSYKWKITKENQKRHMRLHLLYGSHCRTSGIAEVSCKDRTDNVCCKDKKQNLMFLKSSSYKYCLCMYCACIIL